MAHLIDIVTSFTMRIAFGPEIPEFGSWQWVGQDLADELSLQVETVTFRDQVPECDVVVFVKFKPDRYTLQAVARRSHIFYCPVDIYGSAAEIDGDWQALRLCDLVIVHCRRLVKYFHSYSRVQYIDHHLKFITTELPPTHPRSGPILWTGSHSNLPPLVEWVNHHGLPEELWLLTDVDQGGCDVHALGFMPSQRVRVRVERWTPERHIEWAGLARAAIDVKGDDFRARHKPPAKALDFIASGLPLAMNHDSSSVEHLKVLGINITGPADEQRWLSEDYWKSTRDIAKNIRSQLSRDLVAHKWLVAMQSIQRLPAR